MLAPPLPVLPSVRVSLSTNGPSASSVCPQERNCDSVLFPHNHLCLNSCRHFLFSSSVVFSSWQAARSPAKGILGYVVPSRTLLKSTIFVYKLLDKVNKASYILSGSLSLIRKYVVITGKVALMSRVRSPEMNPDISGH